MSKIYNKNAREKALLEEAYSSVYNEGVNYSDTSGGAARRAAANRKQLHKAGAVRLQSPEGTSRATLPKDDPKIEELKKQGYTEIPIEDAEDTDDYDINKVEFQSRTADDATEWALRQNKKDEEHDEYNPGYGKVEDAEMEFDERGFAKNTEAGREGENGDFGNRNLKDELEEIQNLVDDFLGMHFDAGDHDDIAKAIHHVKTLLSDITDDGKYSREPSNIGQPGAQY